MSLAELLVAISLSAVVLLTGTWLLLQLLHDASREVGKPPAVGGPDQLALELMSRDAQRARRAPERRGEWRTEQGAILFEMPDGRLVVYHREDDRLLRTVIGEPHEPERVRQLVDDVVGADFARRGNVFHLRLTRSGHPGRHAVVLGRNLGRHLPGEGGG